MTATQLYAGVDQPDGAALTISGITYRCHLWIHDPTRAVRAKIVRVQADGAEVEVTTDIVYTVTSDFGPDCTKIVASNTTFVAMWLEGDLNVLVPINPVIRMATIDMATFGTTPTWTDRGTFAVERFMYDVQPVLEDGTDFVVAYVDTGNIGRVRRLNGYTWAAAVYDVLGTNSNVVALRCMSIYAHEDDDAVVVVYERTGANQYQIWATALLATLGSHQGTAQIFTALPASYLWQCRMARYAAGDVAVVCEVSDQTYTNYAIPGLAAVRISSATATPSFTEVLCWHLRLLGAPFSYAGARETDQDPNIYCLVGYLNAAPDNEFGQRNAFVVNLDALHWASAAADFDVRPRPACTFNVGEIDCRVTGYTPDGGGISGFATGRRCGHISNASGAPTVGAALKTRTWSVLGFTSLLAVNSTEGPLQPVQATVLALRFHIEEPTQIHRDSSDPPAPSTPYFGLNPFTVGEGREAADGVIFGGGTPSFYDRTKCTEVGFCWYPDILDITDVGAGGIDGGTYLYCVVWEWRDDAGMLHRSAPSPPVSFTQPNPNRAHQIVVGTLTLSLKDNKYHFPSTKPVNAVLYRTQAGGVVYYRIYAQRGGAYEPHNTPSNDPTARTITITDAIDDSGLINHDTLEYVQTAAGTWTPLPPIQPPAASAMAKWQNRIFLASSQDERLIYYSQEILPEPGGTRSLPPEFNPSLVVRVDGIGRITAMQERDSALLIFTANAIYQITGFGADGAGDGANYQLFPVVQGVGCIDQRSVVSTPDEGTFFQSRHGLYRLDPGGGLTHLELGERVIEQIRGGGNLRHGTYLADRAAVVWVTNAAPEGSPRTITYDLQRQRWSVGVLAEGDLPGGSSAMSTAVGGCAWSMLGRELLHVVIQQGAILVQRASTDANLHADENRSGNVAVPLRVRLRPIHLDGIAGYKRIRRVVCALEKPNASAVQVDFYAWRPSDGEYSGATVETVIFASPAEPRPKFGPREQKCTAFWIDLRERGPVPATENIRVLGFEVEVGVKRGLGRG